MVTSIVLDAIAEEGQWPEHSLSYFKQNMRANIAWGLMKTGRRCF